MGEAASDRIMAKRLEDCFRRIAETRMLDVPILNASLTVKCIGMQRWNGHWLSVLITPWFMSLFVLPAATGADPSEGAAAAPAIPGVGSKTTFAFPAGRYPFIGGFEESLGTYCACSLFSPVLELQDQETAEQVAEHVLQCLLAPDDAFTDEADPAMEAIWRGEKGLKVAETSPAAGIGDAEAVEAEYDKETDAKRATATPAAQNVSRRALFFGHSAKGEPS